LAGPEPERGGGIGLEAEEGADDARLALRLRGCARREELAQQLVDARSRVGLGDLGPLDRRDLRRARLLREALTEPARELRELAPREAADAAHAVHLHQREAQEVAHRA